MKTLSIVFVVCLIVAVTPILRHADTAMAAPFLVCDVPPADQQVTAVKGTVDGTDFTTPYTLHSGAVVIYDIGPLSPAKHNFLNLRFVNMRGESTTIPFDIPAVPGPLSNTRLTP